MWLWVLILETRGCCGCCVTDHLLLPHRGGDFNFRAQLPENTRATLTSGSLVTSARLEAFSSACSWRDTSWCSVTNIWKINLNMINNMIKRYILYMYINMINQYQPGKILKWEMLWSYTTCFFLVTLRIKFVPQPDWVNWSRDDGCGVRYSASNAWILHTFSRLPFWYFDKAMGTWSCSIGKSFYKRAILHSYLKLPEVTLW